MLGAAIGCAINKEYACAIWNVISCAINHYCYNRQSKWIAAHSKDN